MSILIKGLKMPKSCCECIFDAWDACLINLNTEPKNKLTHSCPLVELPDHGELIERDELMKHEVYIPRDGGYLPAVYSSYVKDAKTVIPAERSEDAQKAD